MDENGMNVVKIGISFFLEAKEKHAKSREFFKGIRTA